MPFCGPKLSLCGVIISVWGIVQLVLMGFFYYMHAVALVEDLPIDEHYDSAHDFYVAAEKGYNLNAYNCWIAACLYVFTLIVSGHQFYMNSRTSL
ncbi:ribonuclease kappa [Lycorma delicatula]|uniref:ribonuclease kappa n=1 Tax=Lycorma delicatula TaxID=130591 RepID=UPI003F515703